MSDEEAESRSSDAASNPGPAGIAAGVADDDLLTAQEAAELLGGSTPDDVERLRRSGEIKAVSHRTGWRRQWLYPRLALKAYVAEQVAEATEVKPRSFGERIGEIFAQIPPPRESYADTVEEAPPSVRMANAILSQAIDVGASHLYIEPDRRSVRVRFRVDGVLQEVMPLPKHIQAPLINRYKIMADLPEDTAALPREGVIRIKHTGRDYSLHISVLPSRFGEAISIALVEEKAWSGFHKLGMEPDMQAAVEYMLAGGPGLLVFAGRSGHGTTTTLGNALNKINSFQKKIVAIGAPADAELPGITQVTPDPAKGRTVTELVRAALAQNADIIALEDMPDAETARCALEAAEHGVQVLAAMHAPFGAVSAVERILGWGIPPGQLSRLLGGVLAQRLVRCLCLECRNSYLASPVEHRLLQPYKGLHAAAASDTTLYRAGGCEKCGNTGYRGRSGAFELLTVGDNVRTVLRGERQPAMTLEEAALADGLRTLLSAALLKLVNGVTDTAELERAGLGA